MVNAEQLPSLLSEASAPMRPVLATMAGCGLRVREEVALNWSDVNLATRTIVVGRAKTNAGSYRAVDMPIGLVEELGELRARSPTRTVGADPVFANLRRTYASLRFALGDDPVRVAEQSDTRMATFSMNVYAKAIKRRSRLDGNYLIELIEPLIGQ